ncbi:sulfatase family protein [Edaphobacter modestus]|uniref:Arylsulfatase A-like enzyme n=1 Tax=Edaphobacter modestus TaxID=388466 RepID=A0A4Q7YY59_9BACT|nr:sulfatase [Edaphobacter modestus]RZU42181.1 arylsulfatase A-like enzyme [Edaphobacter modestus]
MNRRTFLSTGITAGLGMTAARKTNATVVRRPNVLVLLPDQWRAQSVGCFGNEEVHTPHLDQLAAEGALLQNVIANSPVCCPARAVILSGTYASTNGMVANDLRLRQNVPSVAESFAKAGYRTAYIGKWHLDGGPRDPGFVPPGPRRHGFEFWAANECSHKPYGNPYFHDTPDAILSDKFEPEVWTDEALRFLDAAGTDPFFLVVSTGAPHDPYIAPKRYMDMYDPAKLTMRSNWTSVKGGTREDIAGYYACITAVDDQVGRILAKLHERNLEKDTIVLFTSDHGNMLGSHGKTLKQKPWEESIRIPGILRYPARLRSGQQNDTVFTHVDFAPTLLSLCGLPVPAAMQGQNLASELLGKRHPSDSAAALLQIFGPAGNEEGGGWRGIRTRTHLYARTQDAPWLLYDLINDPYQLRNMVAEQEHQSLRQSLDHTLTTRMASIGDRWQADWMTPIGNGLDRYKPFETVQEYFAFRQQLP